VYRMRVEDSVKPPSLPSRKSSAGGKTDLETAVAGDTPSLFPPPSLPQSTSPMAGQRDVTPSRLRLRVHHIDSLEPDPMNVHPFVRIWLVDGLTGQMLHHEVNGHGFFTHPCDLRVRRIVTPHWEEDILLDCLENVTDHRPEAMLLFEVMDFPSEMITAERLRGPRQTRYISWGYLKLLDHKRRPNYNKEVAVQLFRYPFERSCVKNFFYMMMVSSRFAPNQCGAVPVNVAPLPYGSKDVPPIYYIYLSPQNRMDLYDAALFVRLETPSPTVAPILEDSDARHSRERDVMTEILAFMVPPDALKSALARRQTLSLMAREPHEASVAGVAEGARDPTGSVTVPPPPFDDDPGPLLLCGRGRSEACAGLPDMRFLATLPGGAQGCAWMSFSPCGKFLAAGITGSPCEVIVYDVRHEHVRRMSRFLGHHNTIYEVSFSNDSSCVLSCSADGTARVWALPLGKNSANLNPDEDGCMGCMVHSCYVYSAVFVFDNTHIATGGFDGLVRLWSVATAAEIRVLQRQPSRITRLEFDLTGGRLWCIDGSGLLCVWRLKNEKREAAGISVVEKPKTTDMFVNKGAVELHVLHGTTVMVQTVSDGCATIIDAIGFRVRRRLTGLPRSCLGLTLPLAVLTPDASIVYCGSTAGGSVLGWDVSTGAVVGPTSGFPLPVDNALRLTAGEDEVAPYYRFVWSPVDNKVAACTYAAHSNVIRVWWARQGRTGPVDKSSLGRSMVGRSLFGLPKGLRVSPALGLVSRGEKSAALGASTTKDAIHTNDERFNTIRQIVRKWGDAVRMRGWVAPKSPGFQDSTEPNTSRNT